MLPTKESRIGAGKFVFALVAVLLYKEAASAQPQAGSGAGPANPPASSLRVVCDDNYPPYAFADPDGKLEGIVVDQWRAWEKETGVHVSIRGLPWKDAIATFGSGGADVLDTVFETEERRLVYDFTPAYANIKVPIFVHKSLSGIASATDLRGFRVAAKAGDAAIGSLELAGITSLAVYDSYEAIIDAAARLDVRVFCVDEPPALYFLYKKGIDPDFRIAFILGEGAFHRAVRKGDGANLALVERGFAAIPAATYAAIDRKWLGSGLAGGIDLRLVATVGTAGAALVVILLFLVWSFRGQVRKATRKLDEKIALLEESEAKNRAFIAALPDLFFIFDREGRFRSFSTSTPDMLARPPADFIGRRIGELGFPPELVAEFGLKLDTTIAERRMSTIEYPLETLGGPRYYEGRMVPLGESQVLFVARDVTESRRKDRMLRASLAEKEVLLKEIHHRVKNNMQIISSLISLQSGAFRDERDRALMQETQTRIFAMAQLHELLYGAEDIASIDASQYLGEILDEFRRSFATGTIDFTGQAVKLSLDEALPLGLIMNELVLNSIKYAYPGGGMGPIHVGFRREGEELVLRVRDEGCGLPPGFMPGKAGTMGFTVMLSLASQLKGDINFHDAEPGFSSELRFPASRSAEGRAGCDAGTSGA